MLIFFAICFSKPILGQSTDDDDETMEKHKDFVPDTATAIKIAEVIWIPVFGKDIYNHKPFKAKLIGDTMWLVSGTVKTKLGGSYNIKIKKYDCKILDVYREK